MSVHLPQKLTNPAITPYIYVAVGMDDAVVAASVAVNVGDTHAVLPIAFEPGEDEGRIADPRKGRRRGATAVAIVDGQIGIADGVHADDVVETVI